MFLIPKKYQSHTFSSIQVSQKSCTGERRGDILIQRETKQKASGAVNSCRQVDVESNKDTNKCQGSEREK